MHGPRRLDYEVHEMLFPDAQVHLYDHLTREERELEVIPPQGPNDQAHKKSTEVFAAAEARISEYGVGEYVDRFWGILQEHRRAQETSQRPIVFVCHSTGGSVVKQALSRRPTAGQSDIAALCLGVTFFATPHHGSSILSEPEYVQTVQDHLGLKWGMSQRLRYEFLLRNADLETLNYRFAVSMVGVKIYSYVEGMDTDLTVLSTDDTGIETLTVIPLCIVDSRSGKLSTPEIPLEDEDIIPMNTTHVGAPQFLGEDTLHNSFFDKIVAAVKGYNTEENALYHTLNSDIMTGVKVDIHQFYEHMQGMKIISTYPCLRTFLELGPTNCMEDRLRGIDGRRSSQTDGSIRPMTNIRRASEPPVPTLLVSNAGINEASDAPEGELILTPAAPATAFLKNTSTTLPSVSEHLEHSGSTGRLAPKPIEKVALRLTPSKDRGHTTQVRRLQIKRRFPLPGASSARFKWTHIPFSHAGWVPHVLATISQEKGDLSLHAQVLTNKMWISQHNRSLHASPHARFIRPSVRCLFPRSAEQIHSPGTVMLSGVTGDTQVVVYLPYLHWDSFKNLQKRETVMKRRMQQAEARPIAKDVALGWSLELKVIWQYLTSDRPIHCRRTLDQYGNPNLRTTSYRDQNQSLYKRTKGGAYTSPIKEPLVKHNHWSSIGRQPVAADAVIDAGTGGGGGGGDGDGDAALIDEGAKVLMVDQLWLWILDNQTVVTFFASKKKEENDNGLSREADLRSEIYQDINGDYANQCADPYDFAALVVFHAVKGFLERTTDRNLQVFRIFDEYISILTESQIDSFRQFRDNQRFSIAKDRSALPYFDNRIELDALLELRDVDDELTIITKLIKEQQVCISDMIGQYHDLGTRCNKGLNGINFLVEVQQFLYEQSDQITEMLKSSQATQTAFKELLDMKQKHAIRISQEQTERAADSSRSIMVFTVFTIIFSPLSFFASVFGINAREWSGVGTNPSLRNVFAYMVLMSFAVIVLALLFAFNKNMRQLAQRVWRSASMPILGLVRLLCSFPRRWHHVDQVFDLEKPAASTRKGL